tara:strand:- start:23642 stop:24808 length:1167 start_codon:yes stop_codon:yes gene_type:complete
MTTEEQQISTQTDMVDMTTIAEIAEEVHPGNWDLGLAEPALAQKLRSYISSDAYDGFIQRLIIKFPETTIRNSIGDSATIHDMYIAIMFNADFTEILTPKMFSMRSTVTTKEYASGFFHPHSAAVSKNNNNVSSYFIWRDMCLGGGTELDHLMVSLRNDGVTKKDIFELLVMLHRYVAWESLEGGPYRKLSHVDYPRIGGSDRNHNSIKSSILVQHLAPIFKYNDDIPLPELINSNGQATAVTNVYASFEKGLHKLFLDYKNGIVIYPDSYRSVDSLVNSALGVIIEDQFMSFQNSSGGNDGSETVKPLSFYEEKIEEIDQFNRCYSEDVLYFKQNPVEFKITLDLNGLVETEIDVDYNSARVNPRLITAVVETYLNQYNGFIKSLYI